MHNFRGLKNPWRCHWSDEIQKKYVFFSKNRAPVHLGPVLYHPSTLFDFKNTALPNSGSVKSECMIAEVYRTHSVVTGPMNFKKSGRFFSRKVMLPGVWGTWLPS